ncbi:PREDICTED: outer dynein arm protein 1-like [Nicrophorus vespilloides]|uniref:Outer dynein arm protein 1-like n=1 Tax=Nicrophorus vespilloides TaxID=110193 RepID=A0ABM1NH47_NICVS|nr:PREDICTED: outer dynein arm protein 1-like [Nicrophorus vespilloides]
MAEKRKSLSREEQFAMKLREEDELVRLKRQLRIMAHDRAAMEASSNQTTQQKKMLNLYRKEANDLQNELKTIENKRSDDEVNIKKIQHLLKEHLVLDESIKEIKQHLREFDAQVDTVQKKINILSKNAPSDSTILDLKSSKVESVKRLENRLNLTVTQFCSILADNKARRIQMASLLRQRQSFNETWEKLVNDLHLGKKFMLDVIEQTTLAFDQREELMEKLRVLKYKAQNKVSSHVEEMTQLKRQLDHQTNLGEFLDSKSRKRIMVDLVRKEKEQKEQSKIMLEQELVHYADTFKKIKEFTGEEDIDKIKSQFLKSEEENYALFNYANALNTELESISSNIADYQSTIDEQRNISESRKHQEKHNFDALKEELLHQQSMVSKADLSLNTKKIELKRIIDGIEHIFKLISKENAAPLLELLELQVILDTNDFIFDGVESEEEDVLYIDDEPNEKVTMIILNSVLLSLSLIQLK